MFAVIYQFKLKPHQEIIYKNCWDIVVDYFKTHCGAIGSCLHKAEDGRYVAYSRWRDRASWKAAWPGDKTPNSSFPQAVHGAITTMQALKTENQDLEQYKEITLEVVEDKLCF